MSRLQYFGVANVGYSQKSEMKAAAKLMEVNLESLTNSLTTTPNMSDSIKGNDNQKKIHVVPSIGDFGSSSLISDFFGFESSENISSSDSIEYVSLRNFKITANCKNKKESTKIKGKGSLPLETNYQNIVKGHVLDINDSIGSRNSTSTIVNTLEEIVEINSNSSPKSIKERRTQRNSKLKKFNSANAQGLMQIYRQTSESSSEFPATSPSNAQCGKKKYGHRSLMVKNTLPSDSFERDLAILTTNKPQLPLEDKVSLWACSSEMSDVEDVYTFDDVFRKHEEELVAKSDSQKPLNNKDSTLKYNFNEFRAMVSSNLYEQQNQSSDTEEDEQPTTSHHAAYLRKQSQKETKKIKQTFTPPSSSFEVKKTKYKNIKKKTIGHISNQKLLIHDQILCLSSSDSSSRKINSKGNKTLNEPSSNYLQHKEYNKSGDTGYGNIPLESSYQNKESDKQIVPELSADLCKENIHLENKKEDIRHSDFFKTPYVPQKYMLNIPNEELKESSGTKSLTSIFESTQDTTITKHPKINKTASESKMSLFNPQHEFCSYLGLTGMSTATALANAMVELSNSKYSRRSLRVRRQVEKKKIIGNKESSKSHDEDNTRNQLLSLKQIRGLKRHSLDPEKMGQHNIIQNGFYISDSSTSSTKKHKINPEDAMFINMDATIQQETLKKSRELKKGIMSPLNEAKLRKKNLMETTTSSNGDTSTCPRSSHSEPDCTEETSSIPTLKQTGDYLTIDSGKILPNNIFENYVTRNNSLNRDFPQNVLLDKATNYKYRNTEYGNSNNDTIFSEFQKCLEASRQAKPSIYIVNRFESMQNKMKNININSGLGERKDSMVAIEETTDKEDSLSHRKESSSTLTLKPNVRKKKIFGRTRNSNKVVKLTRSHININQRMLRNRKVSLAKPFPSVPKKKTKRRSGFHPGTSEGNKPSSNISCSIENIQETLQEVVISEKSDFVPQNQSPKSIKKINTYDLSMIPMASMNGVMNLYSDKAEQSIDNDLLVSSTTNNYEEAIRLQFHEEDIIETKPVSTPKVFRADNAANRTRDNSTQCKTKFTDILEISKPRRTFRNPLRSEWGPVLYIYHESDILIVVQHFLISFWKYSKLLNALYDGSMDDPSLLKNRYEPFEEGQHPEQTFIPGEWVHLGEIERAVLDKEVPTSYTNRICMNNSLPFYIEMRSKDLKAEHRECNLISLYINVYYYDEDEYDVKMNAIQLDRVKSLNEDVSYTTLYETRYFIVAWPEHNAAGKPRSGLCKYAISPQLTTLASTREFKCMRHIIRHIDCISDDKLLGFGQTEITIWDHRSGDVLMNFDLSIPVGRNVGSIYYSCSESDEQIIILLFQHILQENGSSEIMVIACSISESTPSYRVVRRHSLPSNIFNEIGNCVNTKEFLIISAKNDDSEIWINCMDPNSIIWLPARNSLRFYNRESNVVVEHTTKRLTIESFTSYTLRLAGLKKFN